MSIKSRLPKQPQKEKLSLEIFGLFFISVVISAFSFSFLYFTADSIIYNRLQAKGISLTNIQQAYVSGWMRNICMIAALIIFVVFFLFFLGQKFLYLLTIIRGIHTLRQNGLNFTIPVEGNDELTELAESINLFSASILRYRKNQQEIQAEKEELIRSLSHDIKNPLTSIISYTQFIQQSGNIHDPQIEGYLQIVREKSEQIRELTELLLGSSARKIESFPDGRTLIYQLVEEMEAELEDEFNLQVNYPQTAFAARLDVQDLRRIFFNLSSNIIKYADPQHPVTLDLSFADGMLTIRQQNNISDSPSLDSSKIGLKSIRLILKSYQGTLTTQSENHQFLILISMNPVLPEISSQSSENL